MEEVKSPFLGRASSWRNAPAHESVRYGAATIQLYFGKIGLPSRGIRLFLTKDFPAARSIWAVVFRHARGDEVPAQLSLRAREQSCAGFPDCPLGPEI